MPPHLRFLGVVPQGKPYAGMHRISFSSTWYGRATKAKPAGAERLELYVDLVPPDEPIPKTPGERMGGRNWHLGTFTRTPMIVHFPIAEQPMRVVYWGRWGAGNNDVGPFSETLDTRIEGCLTPKQLGRQPGVVIITSGRRALPNLIGPRRLEVGEIDGRRLLTDESAEAA